ncbi:MAG: GNAT family N-acetyltransferase [Gammaproteobacteria bacterium]|nr:MAG: GNAT family N-acetyltransferase [Gammaproteobacteria bacterium]
MTLILKKLTSINDFHSQDWNELNSHDNPFLSFEFFAALENSGSVSKETGWEVAHLAWFDEQGLLQAVLPHYYKTHSYGEYMFDWAWAEGITRAGIGYYPKAVAAIPFTPVSGQRLLISAQLEQKNPKIRHELVSQLFSSVQEASRLDTSLSDKQVSNLQCLFLEEKEVEGWKIAGAMIRRGYQFSWYNNDYQSFDDFLGKLRSSPRKKIRRERRNLMEQGVSFKHFEGCEIDDDLWSFFISCYQQTYLKRSGHLGYLNQQFFEQIRLTMSEKLLIICAYQNDKPLATSLFIKGKDILYGRYWGALELIDGLHFDCCYYQAIDYCIDHEIGCLQPGTQGDYKRRRGFIPEYVYGAYYFCDVNLRHPIQEYLDEETEQLKQQFANWTVTSPYK